ncbi:Tagatose 1,6-diphosphate aldolase [Candidatus Gugararchaeum adminiculabundum]|nr:Tagatose 1,6-diphosphate aldolase [Candidatus Gugararchaeum adminiculabundum]
MAVKANYFKNMGKGKIAGLKKITRNGYFQVFAVDQVGSFQKAIKDELAKKKGVDAKQITEDEIIAVASPLKTQFAAIASKNVSAILLDTTPYGIKGIPHVDKATGLLLKLEASTSVTDKQGNMIYFEPIPEGGERSQGSDAEYKQRVGKAFDFLKAKGAHAIKLLLNYNPIHEPAHAREQARRLKILYEVSNEKDIPLLLEPMSFFFVLDANGQKKSDKKNIDFAKQKFDIVLQTTRDLSSICDVFKVEFPVDLKFLLPEFATANKVTNEQVEETRKHMAWKLGLPESASADQIITEACKRLDRECATPWVMLSAGVKDKEFEKNIDFSTKNGCSGMFGGRAIFQEALPIAVQNGGDSQQAKEFLQKTAIERIERYKSIISKNAKPFWERFGLTKQQFDSL